MIPRYSRPEMTKIWEDDNKYAIWLEIELLAVEARANAGFLPIEAAQEMRKRAECSTEKINEIEKITKHDIIAFLTNVEEHIGHLSQYLHIGMTSSDVLDTCFSMQCRQAGELLLRDMNLLSDALAERAKEFKYQLCIGRTHGIHAEPTTFGLKIALFFDECVRNIKRLKSAINEVSVGKINGAVGTFEHLGPEVEEYVCSQLGLRPAEISTQVISRDRYAYYLNELALIASFLEKIALEVRHLQRTEVNEAEEYFSKGQKGSSAMPHKRNPIVSEQICGMARLMRSNAHVAVENNALWHERDISHSSVERIIFPDSTIALDYLIARTTALISNLVIYPKKMQENLDLTHGLIFSQKVLLKLAEKGFQRQNAYEIVQRSAMKTFEHHIPFRQTLTDNPEIATNLSEAEIDSLFNYENLFKNVDMIFERVGL
ncbi:MAG: adenylosuccinate lyase [Candidatus Kapabacteria bacterium]|nr:adenylosuccinate lyase [Candidatus Kapabacteria bacterium]